MFQKISPTFKILLLLMIFSLITSCHQDYIYILNDFGRNSVYNSSKDEIAFYKFIHIAKPPKNFGTSKTIFKKTALYTYNLKTNELKEIFNFEGLPSGRDTWIQGISFGNNVLAFSIRPVNWKYYTDVKEKYSGIHLYYKDFDKVETFNVNGFNPVLSDNDEDILYFTKDSENSILWVNSIKHESKSGKIISDSLNHYSKIIWANNNEVYLKEPKNKTWKKLNISTTELHDISDDKEISEYNISYKEIQKITEDITYKEWGIDLNKYVPKSRKARIKDIITGYGSQTYRLAVLEELSESLKKEEIKMIIDKIGMYKMNLSDYERSKYENSSEVIEKKLDELLKSKSQQ